MNPILLTKRAVAGWLCGLIGLFFFSAANVQAATQDAAFRQTSAQFLQALWEIQPEMALFAGKYTGAAKLPLPHAAERARQLAFARHWQRRLATFQMPQLSPHASSDLAVLQSWLESEIWHLTTFREYAWNPSLHNVAAGFDAVLNTEYAPLTSRLRSLSQRLSQVPAYYRAAKSSIEQPTQEHTELAISQSLGTRALLQEAAQRAQESDLQATEKRRFAKRSAAAILAVEDYANWLRTLLANGQARRSFRIGAELYEARFALQIQSGLSGQQTYQRALQAKEELLAQMASLTDTLWPRYLAGVTPPIERREKIGTLIAKLAERHAAPQDFVAEVRRQIPQLQQWVQEKNLLELDTSRALLVRETPQYQRGVTVASIEAPGPYRPQGPTYYNVSPITDLSPELQLSTLREYNDWTLQILNIHEAIPGHYAQLVHANKSPSLIKTLFANGSMIEGWALYGERMMMESGYGGNTPEMALMYAKWSLRAVCNTLLDYGVQVLGMREQEALQLLMQDAFQSEAEALGKWRRAQLTSVQLASYYSGFIAILALREERRQQLGAQFDLRQFHHQFLSHGSAPVPIIRKLLLSAPAF